MRVKTTLVAGLLGLAISVGCRGESPTPTPAPQIAEDAIPAIPERPSEPLPPLTDASLYELGGTLLDENGEVRPFDDFRGHPVVISMFYASCQTACPVLIDDIKDLLTRVPASRLDDVRVLLISFDPERDTPTKLRELQVAHKLAPATWRLATAQDDATREMAAVLGIRYRKLDNGEYFHTSLTTVLDADGVPRARLEGLQRDPTALLDALAAMPGPAK